MNRGAIRRWRLLVAAVLVGAAATVGVALSSFGGPHLVTHGPRDRPWIALTFDADMTASMLARLRSGDDPGGYDPAITRVLQAQRAPATIFVTGLWAQAYGDVLGSLAGDPLFELGNHSMDHSSFRRPCFGLRPVESDDERRWQVSEAGAVIADVAGVDTRWFRFPGGCHDEGDLELVASLGGVSVGWDLVSGDAFERKPAVVAGNVLRGARPGSIVVMHLNGAPNAPATAAALRIVIPELRKRGFRLVTLSELLGSR